MSTFRIVELRPEVVTRVRRVVTGETDDWIEAEVAATYPRKVEGTHPTHKIEGRACAVCNAPDNGCFAIHAPCGFDFAGRSMSEVIDDWKASQP